MKNKPCAYFPLCHLFTRKEIDECVPEHCSFYFAKRPSLLPVLRRWEKIVYDRAVRHYGDTYETCFQRNSARAELLGKLISHLEREDKNV